MARWSNKPNPPNPSYPEKEPSSFPNNALAPNATQNSLPTAYHYPINPSALSLSSTIIPCNFLICVNAASRSVCSSATSS